MAENDKETTGNDAKTNLANNQNTVSKKNKKEGFNKRKGKSNNSNSHQQKIYDEDEFLYQQLGNRANVKKNKGVSINHLLGFTLPERGNRQQAGLWRSTPKNRKNNDFKEELNLTGDKFINANYRFIVDHTRDYHEQQIDSNIPLERSSILRVIVKNTNACPICLEKEDAIAMRMIGCGHCFCYTCLLNYLDKEPEKDTKKTEYAYNSQPKLKNCPLCSSKINPQKIIPVYFDKSSVELEKFETPKINEDVILKLMVKPENKLLALPVSNHPDFSKISDVPWCCEKDGMTLNLDIYPYARIMKGNLNFILHLYEHEIQQIKKQFENDKVMFESSDDKYVKKALEEINSEIIKIKDSFGKSESYAIDVNNNISNKLEKLTIASIESEYENMLILSNNNVNLNVNKSYFYYQTNFSSSIKYLLSSLDIKILRAMFGEYINFPSTLVLPVENIVFGEILTKSNLSKYKYLSHFPFGTEIAILEINWLLGNKNETSFKLPNNIFTLFKKDIMNRFRMNKKKAHIEEHNKKVAQRNLEIETKKFYERENEAFYHPRAEYELRNDFDYQDSSMSSQNQTLQALIPLSEDDSTEETLKDDPAKFTTTVWGTKIEKSTPEINDEDEFDETGLSTEDILNKISNANNEEKNNINGGKKKKKKKLILISGSQRGAL